MEVNILLGLERNLHDFCGDTVKGYETSPKKKEGSIERKNTFIPFHMIVVTFSRQFSLVG